MKHFKYQAPGSYEEAGNIVREARPGTALRFMRLRRRPGDA